MRWDNGIVDHWFSYPDLAEFPDYKDEYRLGGYVDIQPFYQAYDNDDLMRFMSLLSQYTDIQKPWIQKLANNFNIYQKYMPASKMLGNKNPCADDLYISGLHITNIDFNDLNVHDLVQKELNKTDWKPEPGTYDRGVFLDSARIQQVHNKLERAGIIEGASAYSGKERKVANVFLHVSLPTDHHYKQFMEDATTTPRWTNLHIDPKEDVVKAIIYLEDVKEENGAFGYVPESNRFVHDRLQNIFARAICVGNYMRTPEQRAEIYSLPRQFRVSNNFGRCVMDDSNLAKKLDEKFLRVTSDLGNVAVFDAGAGMHQGGIVKKGRRVSLQVLMK